MKTEYFVLNGDEVDGYNLISNKDDADQHAMELARRYPDNIYRIVKIVSKVKTNVQDYKFSWEHVKPKEFTANATSDMPQGMDDIYYNYKGIKVVKRKVVRSISMRMDNTIGEVKFRGELEVIREDTTSDSRDLMTYRIVDQIDNIIKKNLIGIANAVAVLDDLVINKSMVINGHGSHAGLYFYLLPLYLRESIFAMTAIPNEE